MAKLNLMLIALGLHSSETVKFKPDGDALRSG